MNESQAIEYLHSLCAFGMRPGLERMRALCALLGHPQEKLRFVHIAGTNGKGSTCVMLESILRAAGYRTGLFISPYVYDFCERIQINGAPVAGETLAAAVSRVRGAISQMEPELLPVTEFEALTATAFLIYAQAGCDIVVLETGLGGRLDSTNMIPTPLVSVITSISFDHTAILGESLVQIAREKCGIFKGGAAVVYPEQAPEALRTIHECAKNTNTRLFFPDLGSIKDMKSSWYGTDFLYHHGGTYAYRVPLLGGHMIKNAAVVLTTVERLRELGFHITHANVFYGMRTAKIPARMEVRTVEDVVTLTDGGHNPGCGTALAEVLQKHFAGWHIESVCGMMADKDAAGYLAAIAAHINRMTAVTLPPPRGESAQTLARKARSVGIDCDFEESPQKAYHAALQRLRDKENAMLLVCGSFVLAGEVRLVAG
ncbi:MAG: bifunctional folylpolyglutamate synthase/dihydrofolate synthase [Oscillospiraceae bacterium]|jgi:dihydrofolate synthase/folylpolyglutamate synthase|nr:bifunctional folylpolyglutamate synthase/dihydrofolate synthase [Oscillospiraceae bacterium]